ncbi:parallel beta helix pectate lyase-like protein [Motilibacter peucedani]|uniref:Parallel beta helix pectate lyase-like protein n=1 Tax=Motilibacter peucedani TaxID=598650 RepID=A0A420XRC2_9ACTN|nr:right-handed parallel beta-helix repeat-containing protein [Motilibacter peucedani]RKS77425.1 parallel beta helix pectate lyase-like protein [Motilibacter peucedani]
MNLDRRTAGLVAAAAVVALLAGLLIGRLLGGGSDDSGASSGPTAAPSSTGAPTAGTGAGNPSLDPSSSEPSASEPGSSEPTGSEPATEPSSGAGGVPAGSRVPLGQLDGATVGSPVTVVAPSGVDEVRWVLDGDFLEKDKKAPFEVPLTTTPGKHQLEARMETSSGRTDVDATFTVSGTSAGSSSPPPAPKGGASVPPQSAALRQVAVSTTEQLRAALAAAKPGDRITMADGTYTGDPGLEAAPDGTREHPIVLAGSRRAVITTGQTDGGAYGLHVTGSYWQLDGFTVRNAKKGIVLDGSVGSLLKDLDVGTIGQEAVHFRSGSAGGAIIDSSVHDTGLKSPQFGEGVYVGSAHSNWSSDAGFTRPYGEDGGAGPDRSDHVLVQGNHIYDTAAEGIDVKEGTTGGKILDNTFDEAGTSGENKGDSWVDVKGNDWLVQGNKGRGTLTDAFQVHNEFSGWGNGNVFRKNVVQGGVPGYVVMVVKGTSGNVVSCDNVASGAAKGRSNVPCSG